MVNLPNGTHNIVLLPNGLHDTTDPHNTSTRQDDSLVTNNITSPVNIMPQKPTCKVVKRQGQTGARIDPKGCKVRSEKDAAGRVKTTNKQGQQKHKVKETDRDHYLFISGNKTTHHNKRNNWNNETPAQKAAFGSTHRILYDTGATGTFMTPTLLQDASWARTPTAQTTSATP